MVVCHKHQKKVLKTFVHCRKQPQREVPALSTDKTVLLHHQNFQEVEAFVGPLEAESLGKCCGSTQHSGLSTPLSDQSRHPTLPHLLRETDGDQRSQGLQFIWTMFLQTAELHLIKIY